MGNLTITAAGLLQIAHVGYDNMPFQGERRWDIRGCNDEQPWIASGLNCHAPGGRIGDGAPFGVYTGVIMRAAAGGRLFVGVDDEVSAFGDSGGRWRVCVTR